MPGLDTGARRATVRRRARGLRGRPAKATYGSLPAWHLYVVRHERADELAAHLHAQGIECRGYYREPIDAQAAMAAYPRRFPLLWTDWPPANTSRSR